MSFYTSLSGLKGAQTDMSVISNNIANAGSIGFKRSKAQFGDIFAASPTQSTKMVAGQGTRLNGITQQFTQGSYESSEKTLDMAIVGEGMFVVKGEPPREQVTYTRNGAFTATPDRNVIDSTGQKLQLLPVDASGNVTAIDAAELEAMFGAVEQMLQVVFVGPLTAAAEIERLNTKLEAAGKPMRLSKDGAIVDKDGNPWQPKKLKAVPEKAS